ncbi:protein LSD1 isoform X1 [Selaginella moellendorffii]|uniref:protein LSD1 isoform X1 n=1 Tax=Selaginella moellendorffii TaxID=88036 RepID=UPI000D1C5497|nr:protein LSD1 isoform X1 [Selaginella moellendorffii]XP_024528461.1 protein LSD1 isoform X1 [Selaginella moellendorffii]|eukprot:XP_024528460.1 protein LSD1 isoform X1 [Selaginella moellendorffii]
MLGGNSALIAGGGGDAPPPPDQNEAAAVVLVAAQGGAGLGSSAAPSGSPAEADTSAANNLAGSSSSSSLIRSNPWTPPSLPAPIAPYPSHPPLLPFLPLPGAQSQLICSGCRTLLIYPHGATNVRCALCSCITPVSPQGMFLFLLLIADVWVSSCERPGPEMAQLVCGGCRTLLLYIRGATSVQCSCCHTVNVAMDANQIAHVNCGGCSTTLVYAFGAQSVKCALCQYITPITMSNVRFPFPPHTPPPYMPLLQTQELPQPRPQPQTVVVENPMTIDESGKLVSNVVVGVATEKK